MTTAPEISLDMRRQSPQGDSLLEVRDLVVKLGDGSRLVHAVDGVDLSIHTGERVGLVGESGSGKTMLGRSLLRLLPSANVVEFSGKIEFAGTDLMTMEESGLRAVRGRDIAMVFQDPMSHLDPTMRVGRQIAEAFRDPEDRQHAQERVQALLARVGLPSDQRVLRSYPHELSGGMQQRALIALALASRPRLLVLDEPTTALDVTVQAQLLATLDELHETTGFAMLLISHDLALIAELCDRVYVMYAGTVVEVSDIFSLFERPEHPYSQGLLASVSGPGGNGSRQIMEGSVPDLADLPAGCRFQPRCRFVHARCSTEPPLLATSRGHGTRCWLVDEPGQGATSGSGGGPQ